jgi:hypothetical protein
MLNNPYYLSVSISGLYCFDLVDLVNLRPKLKRDGRLGS